MIVRKIFTLILSLGVTAYSSAQSITTTDEKTNAYLKQFRSDYAKSKTNKNPEGIQYYYSTSIRLMPEFQKTIVGKENVFLYDQAFAARFDISNYTRIANEIIDLNSRIIDRFIY